MSTLNQNLSVRIDASDAHDLSAQLGNAISSLLPDALALGDRGILLTRLSAEEYLVALDSRVPFGTTQEHCAWEHVDNS